MQTGPQAIVILISGEGSNMLSIARALVQEKWPAKIVAVISNKTTAPGLVKASTLGLPVYAFEAQPDEPRESYDQRLESFVTSFRPDWVVLAGFMRILSASFVKAFEDKLLNIHPSLLPLYPGLKTHERVLADGAKDHGATVHWVIPELDAGPVIAQSRLEVLPGDNVNTLASRVQALEHALYPRALRALIEEREKKFHVNTTL